MYDKQTLKSFLLEGIYRILSIYPPIPKRIQFELTNICNFNCKMCQRYSFNLPEREMTLEKFQDALSWMSDVKDINDILFSGWGEPMTHPDLFEMISMVKERGYYLSMTTNGSQIKGDLINRILKSGINNIFISLEDLETGKMGHPSGKQVSENIVNLLEERGDKNEPKIILRTTLHSGKDEQLFKLAKFAREKMVDVFQITRLDIRFNPDLKRPNLTKERILLNSVFKILKGSQTELSCTYLNRETGLRRFLYSFFKNLLHRRGKDCPKIFDYLYITIDGEVSPCCALPRFIIGNIEDESIKEIWNGKKLIDFRRNQSNICGVCDVPFVNQK
jgi:MoaA/NifB/PqqE/SkfB family radical SAM enzyme